MLQFHLMRVNKIYEDYAWSEMQGQEREKRGEGKETHVFLGLLAILEPMLFFFVFAKKPICVGKPFMSV